MTGSPEPAEAERIRFPEVDGLKGIAAGAVLAYQTLRFAAGTAGAPPAVVRAVADASQGFTLFLILAGFAFAYPLLAAMHAEGRATLDLGRYLSRRAVRVYPAYLATVVLATALHPLGQLFGYPALAHAVPGVDVPAFLRHAFLAGDGSANDGWRAVQLFALAYVVLPLLLALWTRLPRALLFVAIAGALVDTLTAAHASGIGILVPLTLGIVAAELRVAGHRSQRFGLALTAVAAAFAIVFEPRIALLPGALAAPAALRIDPFWSLALFGVLVATGALAPLGRILRFVGFRVASAPGYAVSLVAMPIAAFSARQLPTDLSAAAADAVTAGASVLVGLVLWQCVDRNVARPSVRHAAAERPGTLLDRILARYRIANVTFAPPPVVVRAAAPEEPVERRGVAQPRPAAGELAVLSTRTGSPEDLAAEIVETKRRLIERGASVPRHAEALEEPAQLEADLDRPGFYRRPLPVRDGATLTVPRPVAPAAYVPPAAARPEAAAIPIVVTHDVRPVEAPVYERDIVTIDVPVPVAATIEPVAAAPRTEPVAAEAAPTARPAIRMRIRPATPPAAPTA